ncbi:MAG: DNA-binding response regulator, partial [Lachnospiraceae bacterium]|nr:DNA-binding response regulator [Lachnospiraceae bacterium]
MKIAICDDSIEDLIKIEKLLKQYEASSKSLDFQIEKFSNPSKLCEQIRQKNIANIYLLDIIMAGNDGIDIGRLLRK